MNSSPLVRDQGWEGMRGGAGGKGRASWGQGTPGVRFLEDAWLGDEQEVAWSQDAAGNSGAEAGRGGEINSKPPHERSSSPPLTCSPSETTAPRASSLESWGHPSLEAHREAQLRGSPPPGWAAQHPAPPRPGKEAPSRTSPGPQDRRKPCPSLLPFPLAGASFHLFF